MVHEEGQTEGGREAEEPLLHTDAATFMGSIM